jgi:hypothetical protein
VGRGEVTGGDGDVVVPHAEEHRVRSSTVRARRGLVAGWSVVVAYAALCAGVTIVALNDDDAVRGEQAIDGFLDAWERYRSGTYLLEANAVRVSDTTGARLPSRLVLAQRPPDRVVRQHGGITGRLGDQVLTCGARPNRPRPTCSLGPPGRSFDDAVAREVDILRTYVTGERPAYHVAGRGDCYFLTRLRPIPSPLGDEARFCFDGDTGATRLVRVDFGDVLSVTEATEIRGTVTDKDLDVGLE